MRFDDCFYHPTDIEIEKLFNECDELAAVLRAHLYIEHYLALLLTKRRPALDLEQDILDVVFRKKIELALGERLLTPEDGRMLRSVNRLRNLFAHQPRAYISDETAADLWRALSPRVLTRLRAAGLNGPNDFDLALDLFKCCAIAICLDLAEDLDDQTGHDAIDESP